MRRRLVQLFVGLVLYGASIGLLVHPGLGNMPWDTLTQGVTRHLPLSFGTVTFAISLLVLACWIPLRQRPGFGTLANVLVIGVVVDPVLALLRLLPDPLPLWARIGLAAAGIVVNALATALYIGAGMGPGPRDGLMTGLVRRTGWQVRWVRIGIEVGVVVVGFALGGTLGPTTLAYALAIGPLVHVLMPRFALRPVEIVDVTEPVAPEPDGVGPAVTATAATGPVGTEPAAAGGTVRSDDPPGRSSP